MKIFVDSASVEEIRKFMPWGIVDGVTTNQKIFLLEKGIDLEQRIKEICALVKGPVSVETTKRGVKEIVAEARYYSRLAGNIVVKVPVYYDGSTLEAIRILENEGIRVNVTAVMSTNQALLTAKVGASYVSIFYRRVMDSGGDPLKVIRETSEMISKMGWKAEIIVGSIRDPVDVSNALCAGGHIATVPPKILDKILFHQKTEETIAEFDKAWGEFKTQSVVKY